MASYAIVSTFVAILVGAVACLANKLGKRTAQLDVIKEQQKQEAEEKLYVEKVSVAVRGMSDDDVYQCLQQIADSQEK